MINLLTQFTNIFIFSLFSTICDRSLSYFFTSPFMVPPMLFLFLDPPYADLFLGLFSAMKDICSDSCWPRPLTLSSQRSSRSFSKRICRSYSSKRFA